jgi:hypothetical protein
MLLVEGVVDNKIFPRCCGAGPLCVGLLDRLVGFAHGWILVLYVLVVVGDGGGVAVVVIGLVIVVVVVVIGLVPWNVERWHNKGVH